MDISYTIVGDYLLPNIKLNNENQHQIGKYGLLKLEYLKEHNRGLYIELLMKEQLNNYLYEVEKLVNGQINKLIIALAEKENVNEKLKNDNQILWVGLMNNIKNRAKELILKDYIYTDSI